MHTLHDRSAGALRRRGLAWLARLAAGLCAALCVPCWAHAQAELAESAPSARPEPMLGLSVRDMDVRALLPSLARQRGQGLVLADSVKGQLTLELPAMPWSRLWQAVLDAAGLVQVPRDHGLWVGTAQDWAQREGQRLQQQAALEAATPLQTHAVRLQYARATEVAARLLGPGQHWVGARGSVLAEPRTNQLFLSDVPTRLARLSALVRQIDQPVRQVAIEARIVEADDQFGASLGARLGVGLSAPLRQDGQPRGRASVGAGLASTPGSTGAALGGGTTVGNQVGFPAGQAGQSNVAPATLAVALFNAGADRFINLELSALEAQGRGKIVSRPRIVTADQTKALIEQGTELPYQSTGVSGNLAVTSISFRKANLKLEVTPQITPEGAVVLEVEVHRDSVGALTPAGHAITTKHLRTQVQVDDGGTVVLGGIFEETDKRDGAGVPGLARLPWLGWLFRQEQTLRRRSELLVFLTPRVLADPTPDRPDHGQDPEGSPGQGLDARPATPQASRP